MIFNDSLVGVAKKFFRKGATVYVEGQIETRKWQDQSGQDRYSTEAVIKPFRASCGCSMGVRVKLVAGS